MDIKIKNILNNIKLLLTPFIFLISCNNLYADDLAVNNADGSYIPINGMSPMVTKNVDPKILFNSNAILANDNLQKDLIDLRKIGNFFYELSPGKLSERLMNLSDQDSGNRRLKLVLDSSNQLQVTDGSIIILFKNSSESSQVGSDYNLSVKRNLLPINTVVYYVDSFKNIENIITKLRADPRILDVSLDLINPRVSAE